MPSIERVTSFGAAAPGTRTQPITRSAVATSLAISTAGTLVGTLRHALDGRVQPTLLQWLRNDLGLNGPRFGCGLGECGACTVWVDGVPARACCIPAHGVASRQVTTLEGFLHSRLLLG